MILCQVTVQTRDGVTVGEPYVCVPGRMADNPQEVYEMVQKDFEDSLKFAPLVACDLRIIRRGV